MRQDERWGNPCLDLLKIRRRLRDLGLDWAADDLTQHSRTPDLPRVELTVDLGEFLEIDDLTRRLAEQPQDGELRFRRGQARMRFQQWKNAVDDFNDVISLEDEHLEARFERGVALLHLGHASKAEDDFSTVLELSPGHVAAARQRGYARRRQDDWLGALADFTRVIELQPDDWRSWFDRGEVQLKLGRHAAAVEDFSQSIELHPDEDHLPLALTWRGIARYEMGYYRDALADGDRALETDSESVSCHNNLAWALATCPDETLRDPIRAIQLASRSIELHRQDGAAWNTLGVACFRAAKWEQSRQAFEESMNLRSGGNSFDWFFLAMLDWRTGETSSARHWLRRAIVWMETNAPNNRELEMFREEARQMIQEP